MCVCVCVCIFLKYSYNEVSKSVAEVPSWRMKFH